MFNFILLIVFLWFPVHLVVTSILRTKTRARADRIIDGREPATEAQINKCITTISSAQNWLHGKTESDTLRVRRLRALRSRQPIHPPEPSQDSQTAPGR